jgi:glucokinase
VPESQKTQSWMIGADVGGTKIEVSLVDMQGNILASDRLPTDTTNPEATLDCIADSIHKFAAKNRLDLNTFKALGFGIPGLVDAEKGIGVASVNLGWKNVSVREGLESRFGMRCVIDNDVRAGARGEALFGVAKGLKNLVYLNIGTGISAVILLDDKFFLGVRGLAGEIGHAVLVPNGPECKCGGKGCFEAVASGPGIVSRAVDKIRNGSESIIAPQIADPINPVTAETVFDAANHGDAVALETIKEVGELIAYSLEYLALAYDPDMIVIGGSVVLSSSILFLFIQEKLRELSESSWVFRKAYSRDLIKLSTLGNHAGVLGAAALTAPYVYEANLELAR